MTPFCTNCKQRLMSEPRTGYCDECCYAAIQDLDSALSAVARLEAELEVHRKFSAEADKAEHEAFMRGKAAEKEYGEASELRADVARLTEENERLRDATICPECARLGHDNEQLNIQLQQVRAAKEEACTLLQRLIDAQERYSPPAVSSSEAFSAMKREIDKRIDGLRKVGAK